jgi:hypothetical protein
MILLAGWGSYALADVAATVDPGAIGYTGAPAERSLGWRFFVDKTITITHLGLLDLGDSGLATSHTMGIWRVNKNGGLDLMRQVEIGPGGVREDNHVFVALGEPLTIAPDSVPGTVGLEKWLIGVWCPPLPEGVAGDPLMITPVSAATIVAVSAGVMRLENYTWKDTTSFAAPWGNTDDGQYYGVNFKYSVPGPTANAGPDVAIYTSQQAVTTLNGSATHTVPGTAMQYRWLEGGTVLADWAAVGADGEATISLASPVPAFAIGTHTLKLEVTDGTYTSSDTMTLTVSNTPPEGQVAPTSQDVQIGVDAIIVTGEVADFDGDTVTYQWVKGGVVLDSGTAHPPAGGAAVAIDDLTIPAGDPRFPLGTYEITLVVSDGVNPPATSTAAAVTVKDTMAPTLAPTASTTLLWPPNHQLVPVTIWANAADNGGGLITLAASVRSDEPECQWCHRRCGHHCSHWPVADWYIDSINNSTGEIHLRLRAERFAWGDGRVYTVTITATDQSGNSSSATVEIRVPHDRRR